MTPKFYHVQHEFRTGKTEKRWEAAQSAMVAGGAWNDAIAKNLEAGFYNQVFYPIGPKGPGLCIWEVQEDRSAEEF